LLGQSDIFAHFGTGKTTSASAATSSAKSAGNEKRGRRSNSTEELDDDEKALINDEESEEANVARGTLLLKQPTTVSGGQMRYTLSFQKIVCFTIVFFQGLSA